MLTVKKAINFFENNFSVKENLEKINFKEKYIEKNLNILNDFIQYFLVCEKKEPISKCQQRYPGYTQWLSLEGNQLYIDWVECAHSIYNKKELNLKRNYIYRDFHQDFLTIDIKSWAKDTPNTSHKELNKHMVAFAKNSKNTKGLYLYGNPGVGKTYSSIALANKLAESGHKVAFINTNHLFKKVKSEFGDQTNQEKIINKILRADFIFLDDIGSNDISAFDREEVLFYLLDKALVLKKKIWFTSNFNLEQLLSILATSKKGDQNLQEVEIMRAKRIKDRIMALAEPLELLGINRFNRSLKEQ
ncbi:ATP-binding protein [Spiroplasma endosymbiont of Anurida maritima]|uniref:ATP-binding protein n=1 Tax=Spiroplasma endosymbiont of Anurida maritima TaxID=2967972 RepID=UPI0036D268A3